MNSLVAMERDNQECLFCRHILGIHSESSVPHHIFTRRVRYDLEAQITLCMTRSQADKKGNNLGCHPRLETAYQLDGETEITRERLLALMESVYGYQY